MLPWSSFWFSLHLQWWTRFFAEKTNFIISAENWRVLLRHKQNERNLDNNQCTCKQSLFSPPTTECMEKTVTGAPPNESELDPAPTRLMRQTIRERLPIVSRITVHSLILFIILDQCKLTYISPLIKKTRKIMNRSQIWHLSRKCLNACLQSNLMTTYRR